MMIKIIKSSDNKKFLEELTSRNQLEFEDVNRSVKEIIKNVKIDGDKALREYTQKFDGINLDNFLVTDEEKLRARNNIDIDLKNDLILARNNIERYHKKQLKESYFIEDEDKLLGQMVMPIERVGVYIPGGKASYPSTVLMNVVPAKIAGVEEIVVVTPPGRDGKIKDSIIVAAEVAGVDKIYKIGGAQAIAALAFGTMQIPKVDKITGPGNIYVAMAKKQLSGYIGIDMIAGPSEIMIIADKYANPKYIAADMISQAEHDEMAAAILAVNDEELAYKVKEQLKIQLEKLSRSKTIEKSLRYYGAIITTSSIEESIDIANKIAPEHLEILVEDPFDIYKKIKNAGAIFLGEYTPEPVGDYFAGSNHTLPTSSTARFSSALSVEDFQKKTSLIYYNRRELDKSKDSIIRIANEEGLTGHANSVKIRFEEDIDEVD